ncbi:DUF1240 domain-containing protein [Trabulsiella odontotermitis]|uniref:DUF1240 domain-containing protein n=1 Tax=Trabulsiella odontotermitis TaxID=379893 RepID=UPI0024B637F0|nr:DUF1240 domain-containing protein [Trabulsiella odontotermitis]WHP31601.1 DUF1240 domain-containing protein [Trabulsiella odontotermitis]
MLKLRIIFAVLFTFIFLVFLLFGAVLQDFISLIKMGDIISYDKTCILISGIPAIFYLLVFLLFALFQKDAFHRGHKLMSNSYAILFILIPLPFGFIGNIIVPFILMANSYTNCPQDNLSKYYVKDVALCEKIKRSDFF